jgi:hypothetical protein
MDKLTKELVSSLLTHRQDVMRIGEVIDRIAHEKAKEKGVNVKDYFNSDESPITWSIACRYRNIYKNNNLNRYHNMIPNGIGILSLLASLDDKTFKQGIDKGIIHPRMKQAEFSKLRKTSTKALPEEVSGGEFLRMRTSLINTVTALGNAIDQGVSLNEAIPDPVTHTPGQSIRRGKRFELRYKLDNGLRATLRFEVAK